MTQATFKPVILLKDGSKAARPVETIGEAVLFLDRWPYARRDPSYQTAMDMAQKAAVGYVTVEEARDAFWIFAVEAKILADSDTV